MSKAWRIVLVAGVICAIGILGMCTALPRMARHLEMRKAETVAIDRDPHVLALAALSYIKRTGRTPDTVSECVTIDREASRRWNRSATPQGYEFMVVNWPPNQSDVVLGSVFEHIVLSFPQHPDELIARSGSLLRRDDGLPVQLMSITGLNTQDCVGLRHANVELWQGWSRLVAGEATGLDWLDSYQPDGLSPP